MRILPTSLPDVVIIEPRVFEDERGFFLETFQDRRFATNGLPSVFVQTNHSQSCRNTLRGLHYQIQHPQGKLVRVVRGEIFDVVVDLRRDSTAFGQWTGVYLSESNQRQLYVPPGLAHGFCVTDDLADMIYECTDYYYPEHERTIVWNDPDLAIEWPVAEPLLSEKDRNGLRFSDAPCFGEEVLGERCKV